MKLKPGRWQQALHSTPVNPQETDLLLQVKFGNSFLAQISSQHLQEVEFNTVEFKIVSEEEGFRPNREKYVLFTLASL